ncbi:MAG: hypothetical protein IPI67_29720 [Myxococcales bacterium]|nr:hypothetical protein [Myxococcales bacterium]
MRFESRIAVSVLSTACVLGFGCGSKKNGGYSPNNPGVGGSGNGSGNGGTGSSGNGGTGSSGNGGSGNGSGSGGSGNFGGGGPNCDGTKSPAEDACVIHENFAIFVSPAGDDLEGDGSRGKPFKSFDLAISTAATANKRVYACATSGAFDEQITMDSNADGVSLYGAFDCASWNYNGPIRTQLKGPAAGVIKLEGLVKGVTVEDFELTAENATSPAAASMGVVIGTSKNIVLRRLKVTAQNGAPGVVGYTTPGIADPGKPGNPGKNACSSSSTGGASVSTGCGFPESIGGDGGPAGVGAQKGGSGVDGQPNLGGGLAGVGEDPALPGGWSCSGVGAGDPGNAGKNGVPGLGGTSTGKLAGNGWTSTAGGFGTDGGHGQGGGGGGGTKAPASCPGGPSPAIGASGGSGGSGGCGGIGGEGGKGGGASIAVTSFQSEVTLVDCELSAGSGGSGGAGGAGQLGGSASSGASGGAGACSGGGGGKGGTAGHGGGGAGGPSIGIAFKGSKPTRTGGSIKIAPTAAGGGADGGGQTVGTGVGAPGVLANELELP